jgi:hypothetical protein
MWSITISHLVRHGGIADVCHVFDTLVQSDVVELAFELVQYVDIRSTGFERFKQSVLGVLAKTPVTGRLLVFVSHLISNCDPDRDFLGALVEVTKHETLIETGAKALLEGGLTQEFFEGRILAYKERSVLAFICAINGPKAPIQFLSGANAFDATALQPCGKIFADDLSFLIDGFLNSILPTITRNSDLLRRFFVLVCHLAWLDFAAFIEKIAPKILEFDSDDPRFVVFLKVLPFVNELGLAGTEHFNALFRDKVLSLLDAFPSGSAERPVVSSLDESALSPIIQDATQSVTLYLEFMKVDVFKENPCQFASSWTRWEVFQLDICLLQAARHVLTQGELFEKLGLFVELTCHPTLPLAECAFNLCVSLASYSVSEFVAKMVEFFIDCDNEEKMFKKIKLIRAVVELDIEFEASDLVLLEFCSMVSLVCSHPAIRIIALQVLEKVGLMLGEKSVISLVTQHRRLIEGSLKHRIRQRVISPFNPGKGVIPHGELSIQSVCSSTYYEIWLLVVAEFFNLLIAVNYTPLLDLIADHLSQYSRFTHLFLYVNTLLAAYLFRSANHVYQPTIEGRGDDDPFPIV